MLITVTGQNIEFDTLPMHVRSFMQSIKNLENCLAHKQNLLTFKLLSSSRKEMFNHVNTRQGNLSLPYSMRLRKVVLIDDFKPEVSQCKCHSPSFQNEQLLVYYQLSLMKHGCYMASHRIPIKLYLTGKTRLIFKLKIDAELR